MPKERSFKSAHKPREGVARFWCFGTPSPTPLYF